MGDELRNRILVFIGVIVVALVFLAPTFAPDVFGNKWISKPLALGLDLKGGAHLVYEVKAKEALKSKLQAMSNSIRTELRKEKIAVTKTQITDKNEVEVSLLSDSIYDKAKSNIEENFKDLVFVEKRISEGKTKVVFMMPERAALEVENRSVEQAIETLRERIDQFGVAEPLLQKVGERQILIQMPGVTNVESLKRVIGSVAKLEFRLVTTTGAPDSISLKSKAGDSVTVEDEVLMTGDAVKNATVSTDRGKIGVHLDLNSDGARTFRRITTDNVGKQLAIVLDNEIYSHPIINEPIPNGTAIISGSFSFEEAHELAVVLRSGALPAPLEVQEERVVGPTLGQESIRKGVIAILVSFVAIIIFMSVYYKKSGVVANVSLALNLLLLLALLSAFGATLTLPGLAGLALTVGMAVDSNVIIFERIRDEITLGATRDAAVRAGFEKALSAIVDSNLTTLLSGALLYYFGTGPVRGFAVTLSVGIVTTIYCAVFAAKLAFDYLPLRDSKGGLSI